MAPQECEQKGVEPVSLERCRTLSVQTVCILLGIQIHYVLFGRQFVCVDYIKGVSVLEAFNCTLID